MLINKNEQAACRSFLFCQKLLCGIINLMVEIYKKYKKLFSYFIVAMLAAVPQFILAQWDVSSLNYGLPKNTIYGIVTKALGWILAIFGFLGIIGFVIAGIIYILSAGDDDRMKIAKKAMLYSIIGVIVGLSGLVIIIAINAFLGTSGGPI
jgi:hypothetical protein